MSISSRKLSLEKPLPAIQLASLVFGQADKQAGSQSTKAVWY